MSDLKALQTNAADRVQVGRARQKERDGRAQETADLRAALTHPPSARVLYRLLETMGMFRSVFSTEALAMAHCSGQQDAAHKLAAQIEQADPDALFRLMLEARKRRAREETENEAVHTRAAMDEDVTHG